MNYEHSSKQSSSSLFSLSLSSSSSQSTSRFYNQSEDDFSRQLALLNKIYRKKNKFSDTDSNFDYKVMIFYDKCKRVELLSHAYIQSVSIMLSNQTLIHYYSNQLQLSHDFFDFCISIKNAFEESEWQRRNLTRWQIISISNVVAINQNQDLFLSECLQKMCLEMNIIQKELDFAFYDSIHLRKNIIKICKDHSTLINDLNNVSINVSNLINSLHISITNYEIVQKSAQFETYLQSNSNSFNQNQDDQYFTDRQYRRKEYSNRRDEFRDENRSNDKFRISRSKKCFVCEKSDCWSINHFEKKRDDSKKRSSNRHSEYKICSKYNRRLKQYITDYEDIINNSNNENATQYFDDLSSISSMIDEIKLIEFESNELFLTSFDKLRNIEFIINSFANKTFEHRLISKDIINAFINELFDFIFILISIIESRYDDREFKSILMNCDATRRSTTEIEQFTVLQRLNDSIQWNKSIVESKIQFDIDNISIMSTIESNISLKLMIFHIVEINTSFLLCLVDLNRLEIYFNNLINELMQKCLIIIIFQIDMKHSSFIILLQTDMKIINHLIIRRYEHAFLLWEISNQSLIVEFFDENLCYLIEIELRRLHRLFDHFLARRLHQILDRFEHVVEYQAIEHLIKFCHHCQMHEKSFDRFTFSIKDEEIQFNFNILMNIFYIEIKIEDENKSVLHLMNEAIRFQTSRWLKDISARHVWDQLKACSIDTYLKSFDVIITDADKQFMIKKFRQYASNMRILIKTMLIKTHHSIEMMKRYHDSLRRIYSIIAIEISDIDFEIVLQMTFKALNDSIEFDELILILLVFEIYLRMIEMNASSFTITQRVIAMKKIMKEMWKFNAIRQMNNALNTRNDSNFLIYNLSLNSSMLIFRENKDFNQSESWKESFKLLNIQSESAIVELSNESTKFRFISLKFYYQNDDHVNDELSISSMKSSIESSIESISEHTDSIVFIESIKRDRDRLKKFSSSIVNVIFNIINIDSSSSFIAFRQKEIIELLKKEIFISINKKNVSTNVRIFSFRFVNEIKHSSIEKTFENFRLMIQVFNDQNKILVLIQSSIIQRVSQLLIICLATSLSQIKLYLRDIIQAYVQSQFNLNRNFYVQSFFELIKLMNISSECILKMIKSLYEMLETNNH